MKIFLNGGKRSSLVDIIISSLKAHREHTVLSLNGGKYCNLSDSLDGGGKWADAIFWFPNVPNDKEKIRNVKERFPNKLLVTSKRNNGEYSFMELVNRALGAKANLVVEFTKLHDKVYAGRVFDPLGAVWCDYTANFGDVTDKLLNRLEYLHSVTRIRSYSVSKTEILPPNKSSFFKLIRKYADDFHDLIMPAEGVQRFLGNVSFRCTHGGFPSFRGNDGHIFVSKRNVDKRNLGASSFVATRLDENGDVQYWGPNKPSVDTPIQLRLYERLPNVNYMLHAHVYVDGAPFSNYPVPCGAVEEVDKVMGLVDPNNTDFAINLLGHGSVVFAKNVEYLKDIKYVTRNVPEVMG